MTGLNGSQHGSKKSLAMRRIFMHQRVRKPPGNWGVESEAGVGELSPALSNTVNDGDKRSGQLSSLFSRIS